MGLLKNIFNKFKKKSKVEEPKVEVDDSERLKFDSVKVMLLCPRETYDDYHSYYSKQEDYMYHYLSNGTKIAFVVQKEDGLYLVRDGYKLELEPYMYDIRANGYYKLGSFATYREYILPEETTGKHLFDLGYLKKNEYFYNVVAVAELECLEYKKFTSRIKGGFAPHSSDIEMYDGLYPNENGEISVNQLLKYEDSKNKLIMENAKEKAEFVAMGLAVMRQKQ